MGITQGDTGVVATTALPNLWWILAGITSCGILAAALIMEFTKIFVSTSSRHVREVVTASEQGGASLNILSGFVTGNSFGILDGAGHPRPDVCGLFVFPAKRILMTLMPA